MYNFLYLNYFFLRGMEREREVGERGVGELRYTCLFLRGKDQAWGTGAEDEAPRCTHDDVLEEPGLHDGGGVLGQDSSLLAAQPSFLLLLARWGGQGSCGGGYASAGCSD